MSTNGSRRRQAAEDAGTTNSRLGDLPYSGRTTRSAATRRSVIADDPMSTNNTGQVRLLDRRRPSLAGHPAPQVGTGSQSDDKNASMPGVPKSDQEAHQRQQQLQTANDESINDYLRTGHLSSMVQNNDPPVNRTIAEAMNTIIQPWINEQRLREESQGAMTRQIVEEELLSLESQSRRNTQGLVQRALLEYARQDKLTELRQEVARLGNIIASNQAQTTRPARDALWQTNRFRPIDALPVEEWGSPSEEQEFEDTPRPVQTETRRRVGPPAPGLRELVPSDPRFTNIVSYRRYRLHNRSQSTGPEVSRNVGVWTRRLLPSMEKHAFSGENPVACLRFLTAFKHQLDCEGIPEGGALKIWPSFLTRNAYDVFAQLTEDGDADLGGFTTWPEAVQFFLRTYVKDQYLEEAVEKLYQIQQGERERVMDFYQRLTKAARDLSSAFTQAELMTKFQRGLHASIRPLLRRVRHEFKGSNALSEFAEYAAGIGESHRAIAPANKKPARVMTVEQLEPRIPQRPQRFTKVDGDPIALATTGAPEPPNRSPSVTGTIEYSTYIEYAQGSPFQQKTADEAPPEIAPEGIYYVGQPSFH